MRLVESLLTLLYDIFKPKAKAPTLPKVSPVVVVPPKVETVEEVIVEIIPEPKLAIYETIPLPTGKNMAAAIPTLKKVSELTGVRADYMALIVALESAFDYEVKARTSSATGWFQVINKTWEVLLSRYGDKYEIPTDSKIDLRKDPRINALMGAELIKENIEIIKPAIRRDLTLLEIYLAHFFGSGHARRFLLAPSNAIAADMFSDQARANPNIFYKSGNVARTIAEVSSTLELRIANNLKLVNKIFN